MVLNAAVFSGAATRQGCRVSDLIPRGEAVDFYKLGIAITTACLYTPAAPYSPKFSLTYLRPASRKRTSRQTALAIITR